MTRFRTFSDRGIISRNVDIEPEMITELIFLDPDCQMQYHEDLQTCCNHSKGVSQN